MISYSKKYECNFDYLPYFYILITFLNISIFTDNPSAVIGAASIQRTPPVETSSPLCRSAMILQTAIKMNAQNYTIGAIQSEDLKMTSLLWQKILALLEN